MQNVVNLAANLRSGADVENMLLTYGVQNAHIPSAVRPLAVVKVGGEVITKDLHNLVSSLKFLKDFGLFPVVVHGGGPQLNDELAKAGVKPEYIGGEEAQGGRERKRGDIFGRVVRPATITPRRRGALSGC
jgi:bifunctional N-acetylglutamate synthase/kinase